MKHSRVLAYVVSNLIFLNHNSNNSNSHSNSNNNNDSNSDSNSSDNEYKLKYLVHFLVVNKVHIHLILTTYALYNRSKLKSKN